jgi:hypothetical protein
MTARRLLALAASVTVAGLVAAITSAPASARTVDDRCVQQRGPIPVRSLSAAARTGCPLAGRIVTDGRVSVMVPPVGTSAAGEGIGRHGEVRGLTVTNTGTTVRATRDSAGAAGGGWYLAPLHSTTTPAPGTITGTMTGTMTSTTGRAVSPRAGSPAACQDRTYHLEHHKWSSHLRYRINLAKMPKRFHKSDVTRQIQRANGNMVKGRNTCGRPRLRTPSSRYLGHTSAKPNIAATRSRVTCGSFNTRNVVGFGGLPGGLLGWTCYWWSSGSGRMIGADMRIDNGKYLSTHLPKTCTNKWDLEGTVTHEWGHAYGLAHTGSGHQNLTMQHLLAPCSTYARTLGLGDWLGMNTMYGHRR